MAYFPTGALSLAIAILIFGYGNALWYTMTNLIGATPATRSKASLKQGNQFPWKRVLK